MTAAEKAAETRKLHKEKQEQRELREKRIREAKVNALLDILESNEVTASMKYDALMYLNELGRY